MQRALITGLILGVLLAVLGVFVTLRKMAFFGDGVAHASLAGIALAVLTGVSPLPLALLWAVVVALLVYWLERGTRLPSDTIIGIFFTASMAIGVILMNFTAGYQPELISFLFGNILSIRPFDIGLIAVISALILIWMAFNGRELVFTSLSEETARVGGVNTKAQTMLLYVALAMATVLGVKILGIILISALLILPSATARLLTKSFLSFLAWTIVIAELTIVIGLFSSFYFDLPSGATIVLAGTVLFGLGFLLRRA